MDENNEANSSSSSSYPVEIDRFFDSIERLPGEIESSEPSRSLENASNLHTSNRESDEKIAIDNIFAEKEKVLTRIATIKRDGTVLLDLLNNEDATAQFEDAYTQPPFEETNGMVDFQNMPPMQIAILIVGTRGDVQPFLAIAKRLKELGHRVRLATHANFKEFVLDAGVEFYPLGGDPKVLAEYMVKNKGFLPSHPSEVHTQRNQIKDIVFSLHPACTEPDPDTGAPFKVDAIIANPPAYGHEHVAEALKVPLHIFFTMPWTPTGEFPHPLSRVKHPPGPAGYKVMQLSYYVVDLMIWLGIRDIINELRKIKLKVETVGFHAVSEKALNTPHGYIWSPSLVPKPKDWGSKVDVAGFCFLDLASNYTPPEPLVKWLKSGEKPIYIGFGSLPVEEPEKLTKTIVEALEATGQRGIINKGWGGLGKLEEPRDFVYLLDNVPHDWLFLQCKAVVHHGGAGTTAAGLKAACPTTVIPFFGDQPFWGEQVHARRVGPAPIPIEEFNKKALIKAIKYMLDPKVKEKATEIATAMESEEGVTGAVNAFFKHLPPKSPHPNSPPPVPEEESPGFMKRLAYKIHCLVDPENDLKQ
ncbi:hypothetical protein LUZ63_010649 [Rhynchospora breviuscula]|uniref:Glycosyltransferase family 28 N-terminal domain-containing protein n=1 Tax=Rhynchospora breviuscula TaxID=2022672 RepID=A0A9Q0CH99_9POAL|nr:hypothetical protein LUZ63_010649 [Rhynchospora breviuscula]